MMGDGSGPDGRGPDHHGKPQGVDWPDRCVDQALHELGGQRPPDLSARILVALREESQSRGPLPTLQPGATPAAATSAGPARAPTRSLVMAAACVLVGVLTGTLAAYVVGRSDGEEQILRGRLEARVLAGAVDFAEVDFAEVDFAEVQLAAGGHARGSRQSVREAPEPAWTRVAAAAQVYTVFARSGTRLRAEHPAKLQLGSFPTLRMAAKTELEVRSMEFSMKNGVVAASSLTLGVVIGMVSWSAWGSSGDAVAGETVELKAGPDQDALAAENARLLARVASLQEENGRLLTMRENAPPSTVVDATPAPTPEEPAAPKPAKAMAFDAGEYADALKDVDWEKMGAATFQMQPLMNELVESLEETGEISPELAVKIEQLNANLIAQIPKMLKAGLPGTGANGAYTHPLVVANTLASTLNAAGQPLDAGQQAALDGLVKSFGAELDGVEAGQYEFAGESLLEEVAAKDRFYEEMSQRLTPEQFAAIYPEGSNSFDGLSLFGSGLLTRQFVKPIPAKDATEFARRAGSRIGEELGLTDAETQQLRAVVEASSQRVAELWEHPGSDAERKLNFLRKGRTMVAMRHQVSMMREIVRTMNLSAEQKQKLMKFRGVLVPLPLQ